MEPSTRLTDSLRTDLEIQRTVSGGLGIVYMGPDRLQADRWYALKTYRGPADPRIEASFMREALTWIGLWPHANVLVCHEVTKINGRVYIKLPYVARGNLRSHLHHGHRLTTRLSWAQMISCGLLHLHSPDPELLRPWPIVHRDLKPENILLSQQDVARITDFGIARAFEQQMPEDDEAAGDEHGDAEGDPHDEEAARRSIRLQTEHGIAIGTPAYMAPEQWNAPSLVGTPTDMYAFGVVLSEIFARRHPLLSPASARSQRDLWRWLHAQQRPQPLRDAAPELPAEVEALYYACLEKRPVDRPTASEALAVLRHAAEEMGEAPYAPGTYDRTPANVAARLGMAGNAYERFQLYEDAFERYKRALMLCPANMLLLARQATVLASLKRQDEAIQYMEQAFEVAETDAERADCWQYKAHMLLALRRYAEADTAFAEFLRLRPEIASAWHRRATSQVFWAFCEYRAGQVAEAHEHLLSAKDCALRAVRLTRDSDDRTIAGLYGSICRELDDWDTSEPWTQWCRMTKLPSGDLKLTIKTGHITKRDS